MFRLEAGPRGREIARTRARWRPVDDVASAIGWWGDFAREESHVTTAQPGKTQPKTGRNEPCPCGSGRKFKKCCGS